MTIIFVTFYGNGFSITVQRGGVWGGGLPPERNIMRYTSNYLHENVGLTAIRRTKNEKWSNKHL